MNLVFLCGARDYHAMDWYHSALRSNMVSRVTILTDLIESEGYTKLISERDIVHKMFVLDRFLFKKETKIGNVWRNILKLLFIPIQVLLVKKYHSRNPNSVYYAHSMYYIWLAGWAKVPFIGTPQGSDILVKPLKSKLYFYFSKINVRKSKMISVDSLAMKRMVKKLFNVDAVIIQNGIDISSIQKIKNVSKSNRNIVLSFRGMSSLYKIDEIINSRNKFSPNQEISFVYPFQDHSYLTKLRFYEKDKIIGRLSRIDLYKKFCETKLAISIPESDSSPRSVYEAIFCGCIVLLSGNNFIQDLPKCMRNRIIIKSDSENWFTQAIENKLQYYNEEYIPSEEAINKFDQFRNFERKLKAFYERA